MNSWINIDVDVEEMVQDNTKQHIEINLNMDELDLTDAEKKATYQEIKDYVLEHSGLKVSSLYIAQVKQKCGIIERENYNKPKSEDAKQPQCPPEKEKAIMEALKHFGMIWWGEYVIASCDDLILNDNLEKYLKSVTEENP